MTAYPQYSIPETQTASSCGTANVVRIDFDPSPPAPPRVRLMDCTFTGRPTAMTLKRQKALLRSIAADDGADWYLVNDRRKKRSWLMSLDEAYLLVALCVARTSSLLSAPTPPGAA